MVEKIIKYYEEPIDGREAELIGLVKAVVREY